MLQSSDPSWPFSALSTYYGGDETLTLQFAGGDYSLSLFTLVSDSLVNQLSLAPDVPTVPGETLGWVYSGPWMCTTGIAVAK